MKIRKSNIPHASMENPYRPYPDSYEDEQVHPYKETVFSINTEDFIRIQQPEHKKRFIDGWDSDTMSIVVAERGLLYKGLARFLGKEARPIVYFTGGLPPVRERLLQEGVIISNNQTPNQPPESITLSDVNRTPHAK